MGMFGPLVGFLGTGGVGVPQAPAPINVATQWALLKADDGTLLASTIGSAGADFMVILDEVDGGADQIGAADMKTVINTPLFQVADTTLDLDCAHIDALTDTLRMATAGAWNPGNESWAFLTIGTLTDAGAGNDQYLGNTDAIIDGFEVKIPTSNNVSITAFGTAADVEVSTIAENHYIAGQDRGNLLSIMGLSDQNSTEFHGVTNLGQAVVGTAMIDAITSTNPMGVGKSRANARQGRHAFVAGWSGVNAEQRNWSQTPRQAVDSLLDFLGLGIFHDIP